MTPELVKDKHPWACPVCGDNASWQCYSALNCAGITAIAEGEAYHRALHFLKFAPNPPLIGVSNRELKTLREKVDQVHFDVCVNCGCVVC